jgi:hypothetical protein
LYLRIPATTTFTAANLNGTFTFVNCSVANLAPGAPSYGRTVMSGTTPAVNEVTCCVNILIVDPAVQASITYPNSWVFTGGATGSQLLVSMYNPLV